MTIVTRSIMSPRVLPGSCHLDSLLPIADGRLPLLPDIEWDPRFPVFVYELSDFADILGSYLSEGTIRTHLGRNQPIVSQHAPHGLHSRPSPDYPSWNTRPLNRSREKGHLPHFVVFTVVAERALGRSIVLESPRPEDVIRVNARLIQHHQNRLRDYFINGTPQLSQNFAMLLACDPQSRHFFLLSPSSSLITSN